MEEILAVVLEVILELVVQLIIEPFGHLIAPYLDERSKRYSRSIALAVKIPLYSLFGFIIGGITILVMPQHFVKSQSGRLAALIIGPLAAGALMAYIGRLLESRGKRRTDFERFWYGLCFAFAYALTRFIGAR